MADRPRPRSGGFGGTGGLSSGGGGGGGGRGSWDDDDLHRRMKMITRVYPAMKKNPKIALSLAQQDIPDDYLVASVQKTAGFEMIVRQAKALRKAPGEQQRAFWEDQDKTSRKLYKQAGYEGPPDAPPRPGILSQFVENVTELPVLKPIKKLVEGDIEGAAYEIPGVGGIVGLANDKGVLNSLGHTVGVSQVAGGIEGAGLGTTDIIGQVAGQGLRDVGLEEVAGAARAGSDAAERYVAAPLLHAANIIGDLPEHMYRADQELVAQDRAREKGPSAYENGLRKPTPTAGFFQPDSWFDKDKQLGSGGLASTGFIGGGINALWGLVTGDDEPVKHFTDAWEKTSSGERYFNDAAVWKASKALDGDPYELEAAKQIAGGSKIEDIARRYGPEGSPEFQDQYLRLTGLVASDGFTKAMKQLHMGRVSRGTDMARSMNVPLDSEAGMLFATASDVLIGWYTDPLLGAGKMRQAYKLKSAIRTGADLIAAEADDATKLERAFTGSWETQLNQGILSYGDVAKVGRRSATAADWATQMRNLRNGVGQEGDLYRYFYERYPRFTKTLGPLLKYHDELVNENTKAEAVALGRPLTVEEAAAVPGIQSSKDIWNFYNTQGGVEALASGYWAPGAIGNYFLPSLTRTNRAIGNIRSVMSRTIEDLATKGIDTPLHSAEEIAAAARNAPDVEPGMTRLYRVQAGSNTFGMSRHGRDLDPHMWYSSIERARETGLGLGKFGEFKYIDVTDDDMVNHFTDVADDFTRENLQVLELAAHPEFQINPKSLGAVGDFAEIDGKVRPAALGLLAAPARLIQMMTSRIPEGQTIRLYGPDTATQLGRLLDMEYGGAAKAKMFDTVMKTQSATLRREMLRGAIDRIFYANGAYVDDVGREVAQKYTNGIDQMYSLNGNDLMSSGTNRHPAAILPYADHGDEIQIPSFKELGKVSKQMGVLHKLLGPSQAEFWDAAMGKAWKPAMLFRLGFAPRAAAEEAIVTLLRAPKVYTDGMLLRLAKAGGEPVLTYRDMSRLAKGWEVHLPGDIAGDVGLHPLDKIAQWLPRRAQGWVRGMAVKAIDPQTLHGMRIMAENPAVQHAIVNAMVKIGSTRANWGVAEKIIGKAAPEPWYAFAANAEGVREIETARLAGTTVEASENIRFAVHDVSKFRVYTDVDQDIRMVYANQADRAMNDHVLRNVAEGRNLYVNEVQANQLASALRTHGMEADSNGEMLRQAHDVLKANPEFKAQLSDWLRIRYREDTAEDAQVIYENLGRIAYDSNDPRLMAIADGITMIDNSAAYALLLDKDRVMRQLARPHQEMDVVQREVYGPAMSSQPDAYIENLFGNLPEVEPGKIRVWGRRQSAADEATFKRHSRALFPEFANTPEAVPWKYVTTDPEDLRAWVREDLRKAHGGEASQTHELFYADVWADELHTQGDRKFLTAGQEADLNSFGAGIGDDLEDIRTWSMGADDDTARWWSELADDAMYGPGGVGAGGDATAAGQLAHEMARRQLQHPDAMRNFRTMDRGVMNADGDAVSVPLREGYVRVYFPTFKADETDAVFMAVDQNTSTGRRFMAGRQDLGATNVEAMESVGDGPLFAQSRYASTDGEEVRDLVQSIEEQSGSVGHRVTGGVHFVDVPDGNVKKFYRDTKGVNAHDYEINLGESLQGVPIDFDGKTITTAGEELTDEITDVEAAGEWLQGLYEEVKFQYQSMFPDAMAATPEATAFMEMEVESRLSDFIRDLMDEPLNLTTQQRGWLSRGVIVPDSPISHWHDQMFDLTHRATPTHAPGISLGEAVDDAAAKLNLRFDELFTKDGRILHEVTLPGVMDGGVAPEIAFDTRVPIPDQVQGPAFYTPPEGGWLANIVEKGFDKILTPLTNAVARHPLFINNAARRVSLSETMLRPLMEDAELIAHASRIGKKLDIDNKDQLYNTMWSLPTDMTEVQRMVDAGEISKKWLKLSDNEFKMLFDWKDNEQRVRRAVGDAAATGALNDTIPFMDDHHVRSQFSEEVRNLIPFWWAQEAFFRRWAGTITATPEAIRKAQLIMQGARHTGFVYQDDEGRDTFMIPLSGPAMQVLGGGINAVLGGPGPFQVPVPVGISGQVRMATPGFDAVGVPGFGPLVGVPLRIISRIFPEVEAFSKGLLGEEAGVERNELEYIFPSWMVKGLEAATGDASSNTTKMSLASSAIQAMQYLEANGHGLDEDATPRERQKWIDRVTHWARSMQTARVVFGFFDPAPAQLEMGDGEVGAELAEYMKHMDIEEAMSAFIAKHPDATPYTVFSTKPVGGATLPDTQRAQDFMEKHGTFIDKLPYAAAFMLPQAKANESSVRSIRALQIELSLREAKTPAEWYEDFKFGQAADVYFESQESYEVNREGITSSAARAEYDETWSEWKKEYFKQHPVFGDEIQTRSGQERRSRVMDEMRIAFADPDLPDFEHKSELKTMVKSYDSYLNEIEKIKGKRDAMSGDIRDELKTTFRDWAHTYAKRHPMVRMFYQRVIMPDLDLSGTENTRYNGERKTKNPAKQTGAPKAAVNMSAGGSTDYPPPPGGWVDGQIPWTERIPGEMANPGDPRHPMPKVPGMQAENPLVGEPLGRKMIDRRLSDRAREELRGLQKKYNGDVTVTIEDGEAVFHTPDGKTVRGRKGSTVPVYQHRSYQA